MPFYIAPKLQTMALGYIEVWVMPFPTREAAEHVLQNGGVEEACIIVEAPNHRAAIARLQAEFCGWSR